jgi:hypothetical protein
MGKIPEGLLGGFTGKVGSVSGYVRNGQNIIRVARSRSSYKATPARNAQRAKIKVCNEFTQAFSGTGFFKRTFPSIGNAGTGYNRACSAIMNLAVTGIFPDININYPDVLISKGALPAAEQPAVSLFEISNLIFTWVNNPGKGTAKGNDKVILVAYCPHLKQAFFTIGANTRSEGQGVLDVKSFKNHSIKTWLGFLSNDETNASNSSYCGSIEL